MKFLVLILCFLGSLVPLSAQFDQNWSGEAEAAITRSVFRTNTLGYHVGLLVPAKRDYRWHRVSLDIHNDVERGRTYVPFEGDGLVQDSGRANLISLRYGLESRNYLNDKVATYFGVEVGGGIEFRNWKRSIWENGDIREEPQVLRDQSTALTALLCPFAGVTVWVSDDLGFFGQAWLHGDVVFQRLNDDLLLDFEPRFDLRIGVTRRFLQY